MKLQFSTVFLFLAFIFASCSDEDKLDVVTPKQTILVYMAGENSLSDYTRTNLTSIIAGAKQAKIEECDLLVYSDARRSLPKLYKIEKNRQGVVDSVLVKTYEEQNSANKEIMNKIITDVFKEYPAEEKGLFLWSHATAWLPSDLDNYLRSFGQDGTNHMEITELREALPDGLDYIIFDACYMASAEVVYELRNKANYILGSSTEVIAEGFPYTLTIPELLADNTLENRLIRAANSFYNHYNAQSGDRRTGNVSLIKTADLDALATACRSVFAGRYTEDQMIDPSIYGLNIQALEYLTVPITYSFLYDFKAYLTAIGADIETKAVIYKATTPTSFFGSRYVQKSMPINTYSGLSIYVPQKKNPKMNEWYKRLAWYKAVYE